MRRVSVVIPSWNAGGHLERCLASLAGSRGVELEVVVVDNASTDGSRAVVARARGEHAGLGLRAIENGRNEGFTRATNQGIAASSGDLVLLLNADCEVAPDCVARLAEELDASPAHGAAAPRLVAPSGETLPSCMAFPTPWTALFFGTPLGRWRPRCRELARYECEDFDHESDRDVDQPPAACLLVRRSVLAELGGLDEALWLYFSDVDLSRRMASAGWRTRFVSGTSAVHHVGASTALLGDRLERWHADRLRYHRKHHGVLAGAWVKALVTWTAADHLVRQLAARVGGRRAEPAAPVLRALGAFLVR